MIGLAMVGERGGKGPAPYENVDFYSYFKKTVPFLFKKKMMDYQSGI